MKLPILASVPHAGLWVPPEAEPYCILTPDEIAKDGDEGAAAIYDISGEVQEYVSTEVARAIVDLNRAEDDRRKDGIVKTHTCWDVPVYREPLPEPVVETLLERYYRPYHRKLDKAAATGVRVGVDCHTMAAAGPPVGPDPGVRRPRVCLSNGDGTCPQAWIEALRDEFIEEFGPEVTINHPFRGGYITRTHATTMPWLQLELSRAPFLSDTEKRAGVVRALRRWVAGL